MLRKHLVTAALFALLAAPSAASASVVAFADVNGFQTFQDTNNGRVWLQLDNFFDQSYNVMAAAATAAGFTVATNAEVHGLLDTLPLTGGEWGGYAATMGSSLGSPMNRDLIWGAYVPVVADQVSWAFAFSSMTDWAYADGTSFPLDSVPNPDMNLWAYLSGQTQTSVPEPATLMLLGAGLAGIGAARRRK